MARTQIKKILVTGGAGFIGSHVTELLCESGHAVTVIDDLSFGHRKLLDPRATFIHGSIGNTKLVEDALSGVDIVIHLAASSIIKFSYEDPLGYYQNNLSNGLILLEGMRKQNVKKIIYSSTAAVYGLSARQPIPEDIPKKPISIYGSSKLAFEEALHAYFNAFGIESTSLRYFNAYGPRDEQQPMTRAVPIWIAAIISKKPLPVFWNGEQLRDYVYVTDIARAHASVMDLKGCNVYNIGSGTGIRMVQIIQELEKIAGYKLQTIDMQERKGDPQELVADISDIRNEVGWEPIVGLPEGLRKTFEYYTKR